MRLVLVARRCPTRTVGWPCDEKYPPVDPGAQGPSGSPRAPRTPSLRRARPWRARKSHLDARASGGRMDPRLYNRYLLLRQVRQLVRVVLGQPGRRRNSGRRGLNNHDGPRQRLGHLRHGVVQTL